MHLRPFEPDDLVALGEIHAAARRRSYAELVHPRHLEGITAAHQIEFWRDRLTHAPDPHAVIVAEVDGRAVGFTLGVGSGPTASVDALVVHPDAARRGVGTALHDALLDQVRGWYCRQGSMWVPAGDEGAEQFVESLGWERTTDVDARDVHGGRVGLTRWRRSLVGARPPAQDGAFTLRAVRSEH